MGSETKGIPTIADPDTEGLGPAMMRLTPAQRRFVMARVHIGGTQRACALAAGYSDTPGNPNALESTACRLANDERIQAAMLEIGLCMLGNLRIPAVKFLDDVINGRTNADVKDRAKVAQMIMDRTGLHATSEHKVAVTHKDETAGQVAKDITMLAKQLGVDAQRLLGKANEVEDGVFEEIDPNNIDDLLGL